MARTTHKMAKDIQELDEISHHGALRGALWIVEYDMRPSESTWFTNVFQGWVDGLRVA